MRAFVQRPFAVALLLCAVFAAACAPKRPVLPVGPPKFQDFTYPGVPPALEKQFAAASKGHRLGWQLLQGGDLRGAEREWALVLRQAPGFFPAEAALGYLEIARRDNGKAVDRFDRALAKDDRYLPALVGRGQALLADGKDTEALETFERALAVDPAVPGIAQRVEVLKLRGLQENLALAQQAAREGRLQVARDAYERAIAASPDSGFLHRELGMVERRAGDLDGALQHFQRAVALDANDGAAQLAIAEVLAGRERWDEAIAAYERAIALDAAPGLAETLDALRDKAAIARLPDAYRAIPESARITRGDLAALIGVRLDAVVKASRRPAPVVVTDARSHWAQLWIASVTRSGIMDVYANHTFQPNASVRRSDLAQAASRVLAVLAQREPGLAAKWQGARLKFADIGAGHLAYPAASTAVAAGVLAAGANEPFQPGRVVTGPEALEAIGRLESLAARAGLGKGR